MTLYQETLLRLKAFAKLKTADVDVIAKAYLKEKIDVSSLYPYIDQNGPIFRIYFVVSLKNIKSLEAQLHFIEQHFSHLNDWWHVDLMIQLLIKKPDFKLVYSKAQAYVLSSLPFVRRWGYVIFLSGYQKNPDYTQQILKLFHDDEAYYVQMGQAWLLADLAIYHGEEVLNFIETKTLNFNIMGKAIQKISDSFRISDEYKEQAKALRQLYR